MNIENVKPGSHFWALMSGELVACMKDKDEEIFVCGGWEHAVKPAELIFISFIELPGEFTKEQLYYYHTA